MSGTAQGASCCACGHPITFHGSGETHCKAIGCNCQKWDGPPLLAITTISVAEAAAHTDRSQDFVRKHAQALGGVEIEHAKLGIKRKGSSMRFRLTVLDRKLPVLDRKLARHAAQ
jgi:hypothetical protein